MEPRENPDMTVLLKLARREPSLNWYAIADSAQHSDLPTSLLTCESSVQCLFETSQGSPVAEYSPHLVIL